MQATGAHSGRLRPLLIYDQNPVRVTPAAAGAPKIKGTPLRPAQWGEETQGSGHCFRIGVPATPAWWGEPEQRSERVLTRMAGTRDAELVTARETEPSGLCGDEVSRAPPLPSVLTAAFLRGENGGGGIGEPHRAPRGGERTSAQAPKGRGSALGAQRSGARSRHSAGPSGAKFVRTICRTSASAYISGPEGRALHAASNPPAAAAGRGRASGTLTSAADQSAGE